MQTHSGSMIASSASHSNFLFTILHSWCYLSPRTGKVPKGCDWHLCGLLSTAFLPHRLPSPQTQASEQRQKSPDRDSFATSCRFSDQGQKPPEELQTSSCHPGRSLVCYCEVHKACRQHGAGCSAEKTWKRLLQRLVCPSETLQTQKGRDHLFFPHATGITGLQWHTRKRRPSASWAGGYNRWVKWCDLCPAVHSDTKTGAGEHFSFQAEKSLLRTYAGIYQPGKIQTLNSMEEGWIQKFHITKSFSSAQPLCRHNQSLGNSENFGDSDSVVPAFYK